MKADQRGHLMARQADVRLPVALVVAMQRLPEPADRLGRLAAEHAGRPLDVPAKTQRGTVVEHFREGAEPLRDPGRVRPPPRDVVEAKQSAERVRQSNLVAQLLAE